MQLYAQLANNAPSLSEQEAYQILGLRPDMSLLEKEKQLVQMQRVIQEQIKVHQNSTQHQWIQSSNLKDNEVVQELKRKEKLRQALLRNVRAEMNKNIKIEAGINKERMDDLEKYEKKLWRIALVPKQSENVREEEKHSTQKSKTKAKVAAGAAPLSILGATVYFAEHVNVPHTKAEALKLAAAMAYEGSKAGLYLSQKSIRAFADMAHDVGHEVSEMFAHLPNQPKVMMNIVDGKLSLIIDATKEQLDKICQNCQAHLGIDIRQESVLSAGANNVVDDNQNQHWVAPTPTPSAAQAPNALEEPEPVSRIRSPFATPTLTVKVPGT